MQAGTRDALSCMDRYQPTGPHGHVSGPLVKIDMGHCIRRGLWPLWSNRLLGPETRPCVQTESHSYSRKLPIVHALYCIVLYCIVLYYEALYWRSIRPLSYRHSSGVVRNPHSTLAEQPEWGMFNLRSMSPQGTHLLLARRRNSIISVLVTISRMTCLSATCEPRTINLSITGERITFTM